MSFVAALSILLAMLVGFAAHRASLCSVKAVAEVLTSGTGYMLRSFAMAAAWAAAVSGTLLLLTSASAVLPLERSPHTLALAGGFVFGLGAAANGGCSLSTLQRLADGDLSMLWTLAAFMAGALGWGLLDLRLGLPSLRPLPSFWSTGQNWSLPLLSFLWLWALWEIARYALSYKAVTGIRQRLSAPTYRLSSAAAVLGVAGGLLYNLQGAWTYTNFLRAEAVSWLGAGPLPTVGHGLLLAALVAGMLLSSLQRGSFALKRDGRQHAGRRITGGFLMGIGGALIPGGNDTLLLGAIPTLSPWALGTYLALLAGIALALLVMRRMAGSLPRVECSGDKCV